MRHRTLVLGDVDPGAFAAEIVRAGGEPQKLEEHGRVVAISAVLDDEATETLARHGVRVL